MTENTDTFRELTAKIDAAFRQAAIKVIERSKQTGTPIVVWKEGRIEEISWEQAELNVQPEQNKSTSHSHLAARASGH